MSLTAKSSYRQTRPPRVFATLLFLIGASICAAGLWLVTLGGSLYYAIGGITITASALLLWKGQRSGAWLYGAMLVGTLVWALCEVGFDLWGLLPRLGLLTGLGAWLLTPWAKRGLA